MAHLTIHALHRPKASNVPLTKYEICPLLLGESRLPLGNSIRITDIHDSSAPPGYMTAAHPPHEEEDERRRLDTLMAGKRMSLGSVSTNPESISSVHSILGGMQRPPAPRAPPLPAVNAGRYTLHLRQQPRAARAGPDGKDRR